AVDVVDRRGEEQQRADHPAVVAGPAGRGGGRRVHGACVRCAGALRVVLPRPRGSISLSPSRFVIALSVTHSGRARAPGGHGTGTTTPAVRTPFPGRGVERRPVLRRSVCRGI